MTRCPHVGSAGFHAAWLGAGHPQCFSNEVVLCSSGVFPYPSSLLFSSFLLRFLFFLSFFFFFLMWIILKVFIGFVTILLLFYVLVFWPQGTRDLSSPTRDQTHTPCTGRWSLNHWTAKESLYSILVSPSISFSHPHLPSPRHLPLQWAALHYLSFFPIISSFIHTLS